MTTCMKSSENFTYMFLNLVGEVGEFASKVSKAVRKGKAQVDGNLLVTDGQMTDEERTELRKEAGDVLWQLSGLCTVMGWKLEDVAKENLDKLASRQQRHVIDGSGDNR